MTGGVASNLADVVGAIEYRRRAFALPGTDREARALIKRIEWSIEQGDDLTVPFAPWFVRHALHLMTTRWFKFIESRRPYNVMARREGVYSRGQL